jgi:hypothetical protein
LLDFAIKGELLRNTLLEECGANSPVARSHKQFRHAGTVKGLDDVAIGLSALQKQIWQVGIGSLAHQLIRSTADVRREVREIQAAFEGNPRLIMGDGDQVVYETPDENLWAKIHKVVTLAHSA